MGIWGFLLVLVLMGITLYTWLLITHRFLPDRPVEDPLIKRPLLELGLGLAGLALEAALIILPLLVALHWSFSLDGLLVAML